MVSKDHKLSVRRQCALLTLSRSNLYYEPKGESAENLRFMEIIDMTLPKTFNNWLDFERGFWRRQSGCFEPAPKTRNFGTFGKAAVRAHPTLHPNFIQVA